jgi:hypothetical protein
MGRCARVGKNMAKSTGDPGSIHDKQLQWRNNAAAHYREYAAQLRDLADGERDVVIRDRLRAIANQYEALADDLERNPDPQPLE